MAKKDMRLVKANCSQSAKLLPVLNAWCDLQEKYARMEEEPAYDHSELANTSLLVSAANSLEGWVGIAEHVVLRGRIENSRTSSGHLDAYLDCRDKGYCFELKQSWLRIGKNPETGFVLDGGDHLQDAKKQIEELRAGGVFYKEECDFCFGSYYVANIAESNELPSRSNALRWMADFCDEQGFGVYVVFSPGLGKKSLMRGPNGGHYRPCVAFGLNIHLG